MNALRIFVFVPLVFFLFSLSSLSCIEQSATCFCDSRTPTTPIKITSFFAYRDSLPFVKECFWPSKVALPSKHSGCCVTFHTRTISYLATSHYGSLSD